MYHLSHYCFGKKSIQLAQTSSVEIKFTSNSVYHAYSNIWVVWGYKCIDVSAWLTEIFLSAVIVVGYNRTYVNVFEADGPAELIVTINEPAPEDPIETSFYLLVNTQDETATGLLWIIPIPIATQSI